ncbi:MAG: flagellar biosynthesis protein FlhF [Treponema sp.]|nr:flagellar biosynthesis protein FlhF [Candidatus Treponema caballi]
MSNFEYVTGRTYKECIQKIESLYGKNYQELQKKFVKTGGFLGFFQQDGVKVTYMVTENQTSKYMPPVPKVTSEHDFEQERDKILKNQGVQISSEKKNEDNQSIQKILDEVQSIRQDLTQIKSTGPVDDEPDSIVKIRDILENNEFSPAYVRAMVEKIRRQFSLEGLNDFEAVKASVIKWIEDTITVDDVDAKEPPKIIILVGPTGVGKTTTVAKLAAKYSPSTRNVSMSKKVHILTIDNYRIGGKYQMETYGKIMDIPVDGCSNAVEMSQKIEQYAPESDTILIDTIGFSPRDFDHIAKMKETLALQGINAVVYLAMMASTKASDMREIMHQYELFDYDDVIITKLDETGCVGNLISIVSEKGKKFAYYTTGQRVPADIEKASSAKLIGMLRGLKSSQAQQELEFPAE